MIVKGMTYAMVLACILSFYGETPGVRRCSFVTFWKALLVGLVVVACARRVWWVPGLPQSCFTVFSCDLQLDRLTT